MAVWPNGERLASGIGSPVAALPRKKLPIGIQNLRELREQGHYYVDKSGLAIDLINLLAERRIFTPDLGRIDMTVLAAGAVWVFEFKVVELVPQGRALAQIRDRGGPIKVRG